MTSLLLPADRLPGDGLVPRQMLNRYREIDPKRYQRERQRDRSLLFVAATRARDALVVFWHGTPSPFLTSRLVQQPTTLRAGGEG